MGLEKGTQLQQQQCVALSKPLTLPKSWLGPLDMGERETLILSPPSIPPWLTNCHFWPHQDPNRKEGEVTWKKCWLNYCWKMVTCPLGLRVFQVDTFSGECFYGFSRDLLLGHCKYNIGRGREPLSSDPTHLSRRSPQLGSTGQYSSQGLYSWTLSHAPSLSSHRKVGSVVPSVILDLLAQPYWVA